MKIYEIKCRRVFAEPGQYAYIAEAQVEEEGGNDTFVAIQEYDGLDMTVAKQGMYDFLCGDGGDPAEEFLEEYTSVEDAAGSAYAEVFRKLVEVIGMLGGC